MKRLGGDTTRAEACFSMLLLRQQPLIWGDPISVPVSRACSKGRAVARKHFSADRKSAAAIVAIRRNQRRREGPNITCKEPATDDLEATT